MMSSPNITLSLSDCKWQVARYSFASFRASFALCCFFFNRDETGRETENDERETCIARREIRFSPGRSSPIRYREHGVCSSTTGSGNSARDALLLLSHPVLSRPVPYTQRVPRLATLSSLRPSEPLCHEQLWRSTLFQPFGSLFSDSKPLRPNLQPPSTVLPRRDV